MSCIAGFSGTRYEVESFNRDDFDQDQDIPWMDGYFVRWPEKAANGR